MAWLFLLCAGFFEVGFTTFLKLSEGFTKPWAILGFFLCISASFAFLMRATQVIPMGTAYAVWTGIGAFGTAVAGLVFFDEPATFARLAFLTLLIGSVVGLKAVS